MYVLGFNGCLVSRFPFISCRRMDFARVALSVRRVPISTIASPIVSTLSKINWVVGLIFKRSVHQRNVLLGTGYPLPRKLIQKLSSNLGTVVCTVMGSFCSEAAVRIQSSTSTI